MDEAFSTPQDTEKYNVDELLLKLGLYFDLREDLLYIYPQDPTKYEQFLIEYGIATKEELTAVRNGTSPIEIVNGIDPLLKMYRYYDLIPQSREWSDSGLKVGLVHGSFDGPTLGHFRLFALMKNGVPFIEGADGKMYEVSGATPCDRLIVCVDSNKLTSSRYNKIGSITRPRFPQIYARMYEIASSPYVDAVLMSPVNWINIDAGYNELYDNLRVGALGMARWNPLRNQRRSAQLLNVFTWDHEFARKISSTRLFESATPEELLHYKQKLEELDRAVRLRLQIRYPESVLFNHHLLG